MPDNATESVVDLELELLDLYRDISALSEFENEAQESDENFDKWIARLKKEALNTIDGLRYLIAHKDRSNTDKASIILLLAISLAGEVRASEEAREQLLPKPVQASS